jgi:fatty acid/phospholipid biosynthesis enzyme
MSGKNPRLTPLQSRKQLLIAESELNRAQLAQEWESMAGGLHAARHRAKSYLSLASTAAVVAAGLTAFRRHKPAENGAKHSWLPTILKGAGLVTTLWRTFGSAKHGRDRD